MEIDKSEIQKMVNLLWTVISQLMFQQAGAQDDVCHKLWQCNSQKYDDMLTFQGMYNGAEGRDANSDQEGVYTNI